MRPSWMRGVRVCVRVRRKPGPKHSHGRPAAKASRSARSKRRFGSGTAGGSTRASAAISCVSGRQRIPAESASSSSVKKPACPPRTWSAGRVVPSARRTWQS